MTLCVPSTRPSSTMVTSKVAEVWLAGMVTLASTVASEVSDETRDTVKSVKRTPGMLTVPCTAPSPSVAVEGTTITYRTTGKSSGKTPLEVRVQFPHGVLIGSPPSWQAAYDRQRQRPQRQTETKKDNGCSSALGGVVLALIMWGLSKSGVLGDGGGGDDGGWDGGGDWGASGGHDGGFE